MLEFKLPEVGEGITSGTVIGISVKVGDAVKKDQDLIELETDKASLPVPSPCDGVIHEILVEEGQDVAIGAVIIKIEEGASAEPATANEKKDFQSSALPTETDKPAEAPQTAPAPAPTPTPAPQAEAAPEPVSDDYDTQVLVLGGGPGGYTAAFHAADLGLRTTLVDLEPNPGGVCLYRGCIPSKALLHAAKVMNEAMEAHDIGITFEKPKLDLDKLRAWKDSVVERLTGGTGQLTKQRNITYIQGRGKFTDSNTLHIEKVDGGEQTLTFAKCILATGSRPIVIDAWPKSDKLIDSTGALELKDIPESMLIVGGGVIGLELGSVYADLGTKIDVVEMLPHLLNGADRDIVRVLESRLKKSFDSIMLETKVVAMDETASGINVKFEDKEGKAFEKEYAKVFVAIGRRPNSENIGLENTKVTLTDRGFVEANDQQMTSDPSIYAIGDLIGQPMLAHKASHEGIVAAGAIAGHKVAFEPKCIPGVVYTDPEVAWCGLTETEAREKGIEVSIQKFPWGASGRAITMARTDGLTKLIIDPKTEILLGMAIVGVGAGELIAEGVLAIEMAATATDVKMSIHPHPTISETVMESAESFYGHATHVYKPRKK